MSSIQELPQEVLTQIINGVTETSEDSSMDTRYATVSARYAMLRRLCLVCKCFCEIAQTHLFHCIDMLNASLSTKDREIRNTRYERLQRTLQENQSLGMLCRELYIHIDPEWIPHIDQFFSNFTNLRRLTARADFDRWDIYLTLRDGWRSMPNIESLTLYRASSDTGPPLVQLCNDLNLAHLYELKLHSPCDGFICCLPDGLVKATRKHLSRRRKFTGQLKKLIFKVPYASPKHMEEFMAWPAALEELVMSNSYRYVQGLYDTCTVVDIMNILRLQRHSLRKLKIGDFNGTVEDLSLHEFEALEALEISLCNVPTPPVRSDKILLGSSLQSLIVECYNDIEESGDISWEQLGDDRAAGIRDLVRHAAASCDPGSIALRNIHLLFEVYGSYEHWCVSGSPETPWARLKSLREALKEYGVGLTHREQHLEDAEFDPKQDAPRCHPTCSVECNISPDSRSP